LDLIPDSCRHRVVLPRKFDLIRLALASESHSIDEKGKSMLDLELEEMRLSAEEAEPAANHQPTTKESREIDRPDDIRKSQDLAVYGPAPILPFESEARYEKINKWLKPGFGGYQSRFEHHLGKEIVDCIWKRQRWEHAETGSTNRLARQLMEAAP